MLNKIIVLFIAGFVLVLPQDQANKTRYSPTGSEATLVGTITVNGKTVPAKRIDMSADPVCIGLNRPARTEQIVRTGNKLQNVLVYFKSGEPLRLLSFAAPSGPRVLSHKNCSFVPRVLGLFVNQTLAVENLDPTFHNVHPLPKLNREWNMSQAPGSPPITKTFDTVEVPIVVKCNQHPWEKAYLAVFDHPLFATSDNFGRYEIAGIPPGRYKVVAWHETLGEQETEITLVAGESRNLDFVFAGNAE